MKKKIALLILLVLVIVSATLNKEHDRRSRQTENRNFITSSVLITQTYLLDTEKSTVRWKGKKTLGSHRGTVDLQKGTIEVINGNIIKGEFSIDMRSIKNTDIEDPEMKQELLNHLRSEDFFAVEKYPVATFILTSANRKKSGQITHLVKGDLTIKGIKNGISFPAIINMTDNAFTGKSNFKIDRTRWNIQYKSGSIFYNLGDAMINDEVEFAIDLIGKPLDLSSK